LPVYKPTQVSASYLVTLTRLKPATVAIAITKQPSKWELGHSFSICDALGFSNALYVGEPELTVVLLFAGLIRLIPSSGAFNCLFALCLIAHAVRSCFTRSASFAKSIGAVGNCLPEFCSNWFYFVALAASSRADYHSCIDSLLVGQPLAVCAVQGHFYFIS
jgi:hypothetical protein